MTSNKWIADRLSRLENSPVAKPISISTKGIVVVDGKLVDKKSNDRNREIARLKGIQRILEIDEDGLNKLAQWRLGLTTEKPSAKLLKAGEQWRKAVARFEPQPTSFAKVVRTETNAVSTVEIEAS